MNVLSLFDGMSCGMIALDRLGIKVDNYYASEIDKYAMQVSAANYPEIIQVGDITKLDLTTLPKIDLVMGGSPCQGFSFAGKQLAFDDPRSALFFEFVKCVKELNPKYFLLENVRMKKKNTWILFLSTWELNPSLYKVLWFLLNQDSVIIGLTFPGLSNLKSEV